METTPKTKKEIVLDVLKGVLEEAKVPMKYHLKVVEALHRAMAEHKQERLIHVTQLSAHKKQLDDWDTKISPLLERDFLAELKEYLSKDWTGEPGESPNEDAIAKRVVVQVMKKIPKPKPVKPVIAPTLGEIVAAVLALIPPPEKVEKEKSTEDSVVVIKKVIEYIKKEKPFDVSHIRNLQTFMFNGVRYRVEELMKGGGGTTSSGGFTVLTPTETPNGILKVFTFSAATAKPSFIVMDGAMMQATAKNGTVNWTWSAVLKQATMIIPPTDDIEGIV